MSQQQATLRWGILSTGTIAKHFTRALIHEKQNVVAVGSRSAQTAQDFIAAVGLDANSVRIHISYEDHAQDPNVDIVYIATPHAFHYSHAMLMMRNGKHCVVEKPFCVNAVEAKELIDYARTHKLFIMEAMWTRCFPAVQKMREIIRSGQIGDIVAMRGSLTFFGNTADTTHRVFASELAGGATLDVGCYLVSMAQFVMGADKKPSRVLADLTFFKDTGVDEQCSIILKYGETGQQQVTTSFHGAIVTKLAQRDFVVSGTRGFVQLPDLFVSPGALTICRRSDELITEGTGNARFIESIETIELEDASSYDQIGGGLHHEVSHIVEMFAQGKLESSVVPLQDTLTIMEILDSVRYQNNFVYPFEKVAIN